MVIHYRIKFYLIVSLTLTISQCLFAKNTVDSLKNVLSISSAADTTKVNVLSALALEYIGINIDSARQYSEQAYSIANTTKSKKHQALALNEIGRSYLYSNELDTAEIIFNTVLELTDNAKQESSILNSLGVIQKRKGLYDKALEYYFKALEKDEQRNYPYGVAVKNYNIGMVFNMMEDYDKAETYFKNSYSLSKETESPLLELMSLTMLGGLKFTEHKFEEAKLIFTESRQLSEKIGNDRETARNYHNFGVACKELNQYKEAAENLIKGLDLRQKIGAEEEVMGSLMELGLVYAYLGNIKKSKDCLNEGMTLVNKIKIPSYTSEAYLVASRIDSIFGDYKSAFKNYKKHHSIEDSLLSLEKSNSIHELQTKYETTKKEVAIQQQSFELEKKELTIKKKNNQNIALLSLLLAAIGVFGFGFYSYRQKLKLKEEKIKTIEKEKELNSFKAMIQGEEKERVRVARDLHDGIGALLGSLSMKMSGLKNENSALKDSKKFNEIIRGIDDTNEEVRRISHNLMPAVLLQFGLIQALEDHFGRINQSNLLSIDFQHYGIDQRLSQRIELTVYRIIQELINNIVKYAHAQKAIVQLNRNNGTLSITIEDDGKGLDWNNLEDINGIGIQNLKSRIAALKGNLNIDAEQEVGTSVYIEIELDKT